MALPAVRNPCALFPHPFPQSGRAPANPRQCVLPSKGFSLLDWLQKEVFQS
jgi:hypothetical protein